MTTWARNVRNTAVDVVTVDPTTIFHPDIASEFITVTDGTVNGARFSGGSWANPPPASPPPPPPPPPPAPEYALLEPADFLGFLQSVGGVSFAQLNAFEGDANAGWIRLYLASLKHGVSYPDDSQPGRLTEAVLDALVTAEAPGPYLTAEGRSAMMANWPRI